MDTKAQVGRATKNGPTKMTIKAYPYIFLTKKTPLNYIPAELLPYIIILAVTNGINNLKPTYFCVSLNLS